MATKQPKQAEKEARKYLAAAVGGEPGRSGETYERAVRKATASISQLQEAVRLASRNAESG